MGITNVGVFVEKKKQQQRLGGKKDVVSDAVTILIFR